MGRLPQSTNKKNFDDRSVSPNARAVTHPRHSQSSSWMCGTANRTARFVLDLRRDLRTAGFFFVHSTECFLREYPSRHFLRHVVVSCQRVCPAGQRLPDMRDGMVVRQVA